MPEENQPVEGEQQTENAKAFEPITSQEEFEQRLGRRLERERAKFAGYDDLKAKAERFDALEEQQKTELQRMTERAEQAEQERESEKVASLRWRVAAKHGISDDDADMFLTGSDEETLTRQATRLSERVKAHRHPDPNQGAPQGGSSSTADQFAAWASSTS